MDKEKLIEQNNREIEKLFKTEEELVKDILKENEKKETPENGGFIKLSKSKTNDVDFGNSEWNHFMNAARNRQYEKEEVTPKSFMTRLKSFNNRLKKEERKRKNILRKINRKHIYDFLKLDFTNVKYIIPFLKDNKGLTFDYYVARQSPIIKRMIKLINYKIKCKFPNNEAQ